MSEFRFANHYWIHAMWIVLLVAIVLIALQLRRRSILDQLVSRWMQLRLVHRTSLLRRIVAIVLVTLSMILLVFALMRPQWGMTLQQSVRVDTQIMVCLDVSKSMLAEDVAPNRLERAKVELDSLLGLMREGQQVGLIAFAGKATVLCPMTTDFGFLRLVLSDAEPESVGVGGTKIGEAIGKAVRGFGESGDINRLMLLITDGEDHDSFPLEAAKQAKERGVKIVSIGLGDEAGSKIEVTDPRTGVRSFLKDRDGQDVISHLDGEMLRDMAMETDGAYIPAGTGALDLESIYRTHIATLMKGNLDTERRVVRNEAFQWFVIAAIVLLILAMLSAMPLNLKWRALVDAQQIATAPPVQAAVLLAVMLAVNASSALAQQAPNTLPTAESKPPATVSQQDSTTSPVTSSTPSEAPETLPEETPSPKEEDAIDPSLPPRSLYNQALALVRSDPDGAERLLNRARSEAGSDGELRYRTLYNLGWVEVQRADNLLQKEPQQALQHLQQAANRFRESIRVRPESDEARQNLEIVSRRILELTDSLRQQDPRDLATRLDELLTRVREHQGELQSMVQQTAGRDQDTPVETYRSEFRRLGVTQRQLISDTQRFTDDARAEQDATAKKPEDKKTAEDKLHAVQVGNMLSYVDSGIQRMNGSRSLTRRLQGEEAFRRWSSALSDLKRARDQLRNPVEVLGQIIADALELSRLTQTLAANKLALPDDPKQVEIPAWLTNDYVQQQHTAITERIAELEQVFSGITAAQKENTKSAAGEPETPPPDPNTQQLLQNIETATPLVHDAHESFAAGTEELERNAIEAAHRKQLEGLTALSNAWELFFDIRRLVEVIYGDEQMAQQVIQQTDSKPNVASQMVTPLDKAQQKNLTRCERLGKLLQLENSQLPETPPNGAAVQPPAATAPGAATPEAPDQQQTEARRQQLDLAQQLLEQVVAQLQRSRDLLKTVPPAAEILTPEDPTTQDSTPEAPTPSPPLAEEPAPIEPPAETSEPAAPQSAEKTGEEAVQLTGPLAEVATAVDSAIKNLEELRRLFFSLVEHLRDTAQRQTDLNDQTTKLSADPAAAQQPEKSGPLALRQQQLHGITEQIAEALRQQGEQAAAAAQQPPAADSQGQANPQQATQAAEKLGKAAELVDAAGKAMQTAQQQLDTIAQGKAAAETPFAAAQEQQTNALQKLLEALALLDENNPPQQNQDQQQQQQDQQQDQQQKDQQQQEKMNANQLLQLIRDREAERRKDKKQKAVSSSGAVDKDW